MGKIESKFTIHSTMREEVSGNDVWCAAFELAWREMEQKALNDNYTFNENNAEIKNLFNESKKSSCIDEKQCFIASGEMDKKLVDKLIKQVKRKLKTKSEILENLQLSNEERVFLIYAMLVIELKYRQKFDEVRARRFNGSEKLIDFFGITFDSEDKLFEEVDSLFYENEKSFGVAVKTKQEYKIFVMREDENLTFLDAYERLIEKSNSKGEYVEIETFALPCLSLNETKMFKNLVGENLKASDKDYVISQALQSVKFDLDRKGAKVVSEAAIVLKETCCMFFEDYNKKPFIFDGPFYLFVSTRLSDKPFFALRVSSAD